LLLELKMHQTTIAMLKLASVTRVKEEYLTIPSNLLCHWIDTTGHSKIINLIKSKITESECARFSSLFSLYLGSALYTAPYLTILEPI
jgi:hypothetical protein